MVEVKREFGVIGLGRMGANLSLQALEKGMRVVGYDLNGFGGHKYGHDPATVRERRQGQISDFIRE